MTKTASALSTLVVLILLSVHGVDCSDTPEEKEKPPNVKIKIAESPASRITPLSSLSNANQLTLRIKPANISGPPHLSQLAERCLSLVEGGYKYEVCPFHNATQKEERTTWNSFHGVLGVWRGWVIENDTFTGMHFVMGQECSVGDREAKVLFNCSTMTRLHSTSEPSTCHYVIWMDTPLACFKGAMQVYHVLSPEQLKDWEQADQEYFADEITFQGLTKRRRKILIQAGLIFDTEKEKKRLEEEKRKKEREEREKQREVQEQATVMADSRFQSPLASCVLEREQLRKELDDLKVKIQGIVKEFPAVAYRLGFLQNFTQTEQPSLTSDPVIKKDLMKEEVDVDNEKRKHQEPAVGGDSKPVDPTAGLSREEGDGGKKKDVEGFEEPEDEEEDQLDAILKEINEQAEERDMMELKKELAELQNHKQPTEEHREGEEGGQEGGHREGEGVVGDKPHSDEQLLELVEQMKNRQEQPA